MDAIKSASERAYDGGHEAIYITTVLIQETGARVRLPTDGAEFRWLPAFATFQVLRAKLRLLRWVTKFKLPELYFQERMSREWPFLLLRAIYAYFLLP